MSESFPSPLARGPAADELAPASRRAVVFGVAGAHFALAWAALQVPAVREAVAHAAPMFVSLIEPERPVTPPPPAPPPPPRPEPRKKPPPLVTAAASPAPARFVAPTPPEEAPAPEPPAPEIVAVAATPAPPAPPPPPPKTIPPSAVQYLEPPLLEYPRASRRAGESGRVLVRVYIDEAGLPRSVTLSQSSGYARLDEAALAAVRGARFRPYTENGRALAGYALIPLIFDLEK